MLFKKEVTGFLLDGGSGRDSPATTPPNLARGNRGVIKVVMSFLRANAFGFTRHVGGLSLAGDASNVLLGFQGILPGVDHLLLPEAGLFALPPKVLLCHDECHDGAHQDDKQEARDQNPVE